MLATVVVVWPAGSSVSASMPTAIRSCFGTACAPAGAPLMANSAAISARIVPMRIQVLITELPPLVADAHQGLPEQYGATPRFPSPTWPPGRPARAAESAI